MQGIEIAIKDELVSKPYVDMTIKLMEKYGVVVERLDGLQKLHIPGCQTYHSPGTVFVEGDASSASYFLAGATMTGGTIRVVGCGSESVQVCAPRERMHFILGRTSSVPHFICTPALQATMRSLRPRSAAAERDARNRGGMLAGRCAFRGGDEADGGNCGVRAKRHQPHRPSSATQELRPQLQRHP